MVVLNDTAVSTDRNVNACFFKVFITSLSSVEAMSAEMAVRSIMCWYSNNTLFTINNVTYKKVATDNSVTGYTELIKI